MKFNSLSKNFGLPFILFSIIIIAFIFLQPTSASTFFHHNQEKNWNNFITDLSSRQKLNTNSYWEMREFYSPGTFVFNEKGLSQKKAQELLLQTGITPQANWQLLVFNTYTAPDFRSYEIVIPSRVSDTILAEMAALKTRNETIVSGENFVVLQTTPQKAIIVFLASADDMQRTNGYLDFVKDETFLNEMSWLSISEVKTK